VSQQQLLAGLGNGHAAKPAFAMGSNDGGGNANGHSNVAGDQGLRASLIHDLTTQPGLAGTLFRPTGGVASSAGTLTHDQTTAHGAGALNLHNSTSDQVHNLMKPQH
jgi:hypothetical protein